VSYKTKRLGLETPEPDESPAATAQLKHLGDQLDELLWPTGDLRFTALSTLPTGWLKCEGQEVSRSTYAALFAAIGTTYGEGDKSTTFNVPNYIERVPMGAGTTNKLGAKLGTGTVSLTANQLASHTHVVVDTGHAHTPVAGNEWGIVQSGVTYGWAIGEGSYRVPVTGNSSTSINKAGISLNSTGSGEAHNNIQPSTVCNVWIKT
jgi:microcystin-dependent protein